MQESETCLGHCQTSVIEFLCENVNGFAKKLRHRYCNWQGPKYASIFPLAILEIILNLEFHILAKLMFTRIQQAYLGSYQTSMMEFLFVFPFNLLVTTGYLVDTSGYLVVTFSYLIATTGYFWLLLVTSGSSF